MTPIYESEAGAMLPLPKRVSALPPPTQSQIVVKPTIPRAVQGRRRLTTTIIEQGIKPDGNQWHVRRRRQVNAVPERKPTRLSLTLTQKPSEQADTLSDSDLMITLLSRCLPLTEAAKVTEIILARYGNYADAVAAPLHELRALGTVGEAAATLLKCVHSSVERLTSIPLRQTPVVSNWPTLSAYLNVCIGREGNELCRVLFLNSKNHLISDQIVSEGDISSVQVPVRTITRRALELGATALIVVHNHPSGDPTPSTADIAMTDQINHAVSVFGIVMHDHIIVGAGQCYSLKRQTYMASYQIARAP